MSETFSRRLRRLRRSKTITLCAAFTVVALILVSAPAGAAPTLVGLGTAGSFSVLAGTTVTNTGPSVISANLGVSPGSAITGFPPGIVGGTQHSADATALQAQTDLTTAYNDAAGRAADASIAGDLGGLTLLTGVYNASSSIGLTGDLTLDGQNDPSSVWIFQIGSTLTTASTSRVLLVNGAQACNVFWQIGSSATLGTNSEMSGSILALTSITMTTGTGLQGRALARNGAVTLDTNTIIRAIPCSRTVPTFPPDSPTPTPTSTAGPTVGPPPIPSPLPPTREPDDVPSAPRPNPVPGNFVVSG